MFIQIMGYVVVAAEIAGIGAYLPQFVHLLKVKDSTGISVTSWWLWFITNVIYLIYSIAIHDIFLVISYIIAALSNIVMIILTYKYQRK